MYRMIAILTLVVLTTGCNYFRKPYHEKMLIDIHTSEIAVRVETIDNAGQAVVAPPGKGAGVDGAADTDQVEFYKKRVVNARKVEIPYYWKQTKRFIFWENGSTGEWRPAARLIVVDGAPETREWTADKDSGSKAKDQGIWVESLDSIGFSTGISVTARIANQDDAMTFLANYPPKGERQVTTEGGAPFKVEVASLEDIMDNEVRVKAQEIFAYEAAAYPLDDLRAKKREILDILKRGRPAQPAIPAVEAIKGDPEKGIPSVAAKPGVAASPELVGLVDFFKERGITITAVGLFGGFSYEEPKVQDAIDKVFVAQQDEQVALAESAAASQRKVALREQGEGEAAQVEEAAKGKAEAIKLEADAKAAAIQSVADAKAYELQKLQENPEAYMALKQLEIEELRLQTWDGKYPQMLLGGDQMPGMLFAPPMPKIVTTQPAQ